MTALNPESWRDKDYDAPVSGRVSQNAREALHRMAADQKTTASKIVSTLVTAHLRDKGYLPK